MNYLFTKVMNRVKQEDTIQNILLRLLFKHSI